jgi:hypothetical protein
MYSTVSFDPSFYEYLFMVMLIQLLRSFFGKLFDLNVCVFFLAFTIYFTKMLGSMIHNKKLLGIQVCGKIELANLNAKQSLITMMQVSA